MADSSLVKKLGIKPGHRILILSQPPEYAQLLGRLPEGVQVFTPPNDTFDVVHLFAKKTGLSWIWSRGDSIRQVKWYVLAFRSQAQRESRYGPDA